MRTSKGGKVYPVNTPHSTDASEVEDEYFQSDTETKTATFTGICLR